LTLTLLLGCGPSISADLHASTDGHDDEAPANAPLPRLLSRNPFALGSTMPTSFYDGC
jgi:hypothetical protein